MKAKEIILNENVNLFEINMSPSSLRQLASGINAQAGMEFEMIVPGGALGDPDEDYRESEPDYDYDEACESIDQIIEFFSHDMNSSRALERLRNQLTSEYEQYIYEAGADNDVIHEKIIENIYYQLKRLDDDEIREILGLDSEAEISRDEINDAADKVIDEELGPYYDDAYTSAMKDIRGEISEEQWLEENGTVTMMDIANSYNIEWPYWTEVEPESEQLDIYSVGEEFEKAVGRSVNVSDTYHRAPRNPGEYALEPDGSLEPDDPSSEGGLEFISPPLPIGELIGDLNKVKAWADKYGCYTNASTGLHINVSVKGAVDFDQLDYVKLALLLGDLHVLEQFDRVGNRYTKSAFEKVKNKARDPNFDVGPFLDQMREHLSAIGSKVIHSGITEKFISIHPKDGYIEFRSPGGDWLGENFNLIENTLLRFVVALDAALDPTKYRQEYLKKLYKLFRVESPADPMRYFAMYVAGTLPKDALKGHLQQIQLGRTKSQSNLTKPPMPKPTATSATSPQTGTGGPITGPDAWVILVGNVPLGRVRGATQSDANEAARQWVSQRSSEWLTDHQGEEIEVVPLSSPMFGVPRQTGGR